MYEYRAAQFECVPSRSDRIETYSSQSARCMGHPAWQNDTNRLSAGYQVEIDEQFKGGR